MVTCWESDELLVLSCAVCFVTFLYTFGSKSELRVMLIPLNMMKPSCDLFTVPVPRRSCLFLAVLLSSAVKRLTSWLFCVCEVSLCFCHSPIWCLGSSVVLDCIDS